MIGAIIGDIVGSPYEFDDTAIKTTEFELFSEESTWTDDTVMTVAIAEALLAAAMDEPDGGEAITSSMRSWGAMYPQPKGGYGARFSNWLRAENPAPYGSYGNGSAMRVASVGWMFTTLSDTERWAAISARVTHNHPEGIAGAQATAAAIFLARTGHSKNVIASYLAQHYGYDLSRTLADIRPHYRHVESCQETVPEAVISFLESDSFESALRNAISLGGDSDTLAAITGSIAEGFYGVDNAIATEALSRLDPPLARVVASFEKKIRPQRLAAVAAPTYAYVASCPSTPTSAQGWPVYDPEMDALISRFSASGLADHDYLATVAAAGWNDTDHRQLIHDANIDLLAAIFTWHMRGERFCDGLWAGALQAGVFADMSTRAYQLAGLHIPDM